MKRAQTPGLNQPTSKRRSTLVAMATLPFIWVVRSLSSTPVRGKRMLAQRRGTPSAGQIRGTLRTRRSRAGDTPVLEDEAWDDGTVYFGSVQHGCDPTVPVTVRLADLWFARGPPDSRCPGTARCAANGPEVLQAASCTGQARPSFRSLATGKPSGRRALPRVTKLKGGSDGGSAVGVWCPACSVGLKVGNLPGWGRTTHSVRRGSRAAGRVSIR